MHALAMADGPPTWLSGWFGLIAGVVGLLGLFVGAAAYLRSGYVKSTVQTLSDSNAALEGQLRILKDARAEEQAQHLLQVEKGAADVYALTTRVEATERENGILREAIQGKADVERLVMLIQDHHHEVMADRTAAREERREDVGKVMAGLEDLLKLSGETHADVKATRAMTGKVYGATVGART